MKKIYEVIPFQDFMHGDWREKEKNTPAVPYFMFAGSFHWDFTFLILGLGIAILAVVIAEKKLLETGYIEQAKWAHFGLKGILFGAFAFYLVRLTLRSVGYFL